MLGRGQDREWRVRVIETLATCDCRITQERRRLISRSLAFESAETIDDDDQRGSAQGAREPEGFAPSGTSRYGERPAACFCI